MVVIFERGALSRWRWQQAEAGCPVRHRCRGTGDTKLNPGRGPRDHLSQQFPNSCPWQHTTKVDDIYMLDKKDMPRCFTGCYTDQIGCESCANPIRQFHLFPSKTRHSPEYHVMKLRLENWINPSLPTRKTESYRAYATNLSAHRQNSRFFSLLFHFPT